MSKRYGKSKKAGNPKRGRSKNNPKGKRNDPKTNWSKYNKKRESEGDNYDKWMRKIADKLRKLMGIRPGVRDRRVSAILLSITKSNNKLSYWDLVNHFKKYPSDLERCELSRRYCRSWYQLRISEIDPAVLQQIIAWMGKSDANGPLSADSSGFSISKYEDWYNAKYGEISVKQFTKLHVIRSLHGKICAATVTPGLACDSPQLRQMVEFLPYGTGNDVMADAIYCGIKNCNAIRDSGRKPIIAVKSNYKIKGLGARAQMLRFYEKHPRTFYKKLSRRNNVESVFSAMKDRFGAIVRSLKERTQSTELLSMVVCYNMVA